MKKYVVMAYYRTEGWNMVAESDDFDTAVQEREKWMGMGNSQVVIFRPVELVVSELTPNASREPHADNETTETLK